MYLTDRTRTLIQDTIAQAGLLDEPEEITALTEELLATLGDLQRKKLAVLMNVTLDETADFKVTISGHMVGIFLALGALIDALDFPDSRDLEIKMLENLEELIAAKKARCTTRSADETIN